MGRRSAACFLLLAATACGSRTELPGPPPAPAQAEVPECARATLVAGTPIPLDPTPIVTGPLAMAATPAGDHVFVTWDQWVLALGVDAQGPTIVRSSAADWGGFMPGPHTVAFDGRDFLAITAWPDAQNLLRFGLNGQALGAPVWVLPPSRPPEVSGLLPVPPVTFDGGMAFTWLGQRAPIPVHATLVRADGSVEDVVLASGIREPPTWDGPTGSLAAFDGDVFALSTSGPGGDPAQVTKLGWSDGQTSTTTVPGSSGVSRAWPLLAGGDRLLFANDQGNVTVLYAGVPGGAFTPVWTLPQTPVMQAVDGCGRFVALTLEDDPNTGPQLVAHALQDATPPAVLGDIFTSPATASGPPIAPAIVGTTTGFAVVWQDGTHSLEYATLTWR